MLRARHLLRLTVASAVVLVVAGCGDDERDRVSSSSYGSSTDSSAHGSSSSSTGSSSSAGGRAGFASDMRELLGSGLEVDDDGLADIGEGICTWYADGVSYAEALDSMSFMQATPSQARIVLVSAASNLCPGAWSLGSGTAGAVTGVASSPAAPAAVAAPVEVLEPPPAPEYSPPPPYSPPPVPPCPQVNHVSVTAQLVEVKPFSDSSHGVTLSGWKYKVATTVRNTFSAGASVITAVEVHGPDGIIDSEVDTIEVPAGESTTVTSLEKVEYDYRPTKAVVGPLNEYSVSGVEHCQ